MTRTPTRSTVAQAAALALAATTLAATGVVAAANGASAHTTGLHDNCTNLNRQYPHGLGRVGARDRTSGTPVTSFHRSTRLYNAAEGHNGTLDADNDGIACEKR